jgi:hypothetical protein
MSRLEDLAERQDGVAGVSQALATGLTRHQIWARRRSGRYRRCRRGVVQIAGAPPSWRQAIRIASLAAGEEVVVSHSSAARLYGVELPPSVHPRWSRDDEKIEVSAPLARHVRLDGVRGHRSGMWGSRDVIRRHGIAVTSPVRLVIDMSSRLGVNGTGRLVDELMRRKLLRIKDLIDRLAELRPAPGRSVRTLRRVAAIRANGYDPGDTGFETHVREVLRRTGFPDAAGQHWIRDRRFRARLDFAYPDVKVYVEADSFTYHGYRSDFDRDVRKRNGLLARGWIGVHITDVMTDAEIEETFDRLYDRRNKVWRLPR